MSLISEELKLPQTMAVSFVTTLWPLDLNTQFKNFYQTSEPFFSVTKIQQEERIEANSMIYVI